MFILIHKGTPMLAARTTEEAVKRYPLLQSVEESLWALHGLVLLPYTAPHDIETDHLYVLTYEDTGDPDLCDIYYLSMEEKKCISFANSSSTAKAWGQRCFKPYYDGGYLDIHYIPYYKGE